MDNKPKFIRSLSRRNQPILIVNDIYIYNLSSKSVKYNTEIFKYKKYKTKLECEAFIKLEKGKIKSFSNNHNHLTDDLDVIKEEFKNELKKEIINAKNPFTINIPKLYRSYSAGKGIKCPNFNSIRKTLYEAANKLLPKEINSMEEIPDDSEYFYTKDDNEFMIFKSNKIIIFQSPNQAKIQIKHGELIFCDATFYACPKIAYQLLILRVFDDEKESYYTTAFALMTDKTTDNYECFFRNIDINIRNYLSINSTYSVKEIHSDFELAIGNGCKKIYPNVNIKFCIWHLLRAIEGKKIAYAEKMYLIMIIYMCYIMQ